MIWKGLNSSSIAPVNGTGCSSGSSSKLHLHERINTWERECCSNGLQITQMCGLYRGMHLYGTRDIYCMLHSPNDYPLTFIHVH